MGGHRYSCKGGGGQAQIKFPMQRKRAPHIDNYCFLIFQVEEASLPPPLWAPMTLARYTTYCQTIYVNISTR